MLDASLCPASTQNLRLCAVTGGTETQDQTRTCSSGLWLRLVAQRLKTKPGLVALGCGSDWWHRDSRPNQDL
ncbi:uncharacterized [Tachysurus ichikawai]